MIANFKVGYIAAAVNVLAAIYYLAARPLQPGKVLYWLGATTLTLGLSLMRG